MSKPYAADGVDVFEGDDFSALAGQVCRSTYNNSPYVKVHDFSRGHFRGPRGFTFENLPDGCIIDAAPDGIGTKTILIDAIWGHKDAAREVVAMTCGDITRFGGLPLVFVNVLDVKTLGKAESVLPSERMINYAYRRMIMGLGEVCKEQRIVALKGETAELGVCVSSENHDAMTQFNWAGVAIGVYHSDKMITGETLAPGQMVVALREHGFRSNGISSVRKAFQRKYGHEWYRNPEAVGDLLAASKPSVLYDRFLADANGWYSPNFEPKFKVHCTVHVTGGALRSKFAEDILFPRGLSADLPNLWDPPEIMKACAAWRGLSDEECYETWNGGQGALVVIDAGDWRACANLAATHNRELKVCREITREKTPTVKIRSKFSGKDISFRKK